MIDVTLEQLENIFDTHAAVVLWLSGGKDSLTLTHLCQPWKEQIILMHNSVDTGFDGNWENLEACTQAWGFPYLLKTEPHLTYEQYVEQYGWPVDVVPTAMDGVTRTPYLREHKVSSWWFCTMTRQVQPLIKRTQAIGAEAIMTGSRASDAPFFATGDTIVDARKDFGWMRYNPLHHWSTDDVWAYVEEHNILLPAHYAGKRDATFEWPDCKACTWQPQYLDWLKANKPDEYATLMEKYGPTQEALRYALEAHLQAGEAVWR